MNKTKKDIVILENRLTVGRSFAMYNFGDYLKAEGYNVYCVCRYTNVFSIEEYIKQGRFSYLNKSDFFELEQPRDIIKFINSINPEAVICNQFNFSIVDTNKFNTFVWTIVPHKHVKHIPKNTKIITNSQTIKNLLYKSEDGVCADRKISVIIPPIDYSCFRKYAKAWEEREYDVIAVTRKSLSSEKKNVNILKNIENIEIITNENEFVMDREIIAKKMGNAKVFLHLSQKESGPLVSYEALNSGCYPLMYDVGAVKEQLGSDEYIIDEIDVEKINNRIKSVVEKEYNTDKSIERGKLFDRKNIGIKLKELIENLG